MTDRNKIPRSADDDYSTEIVEERQRFIEAQTGASLDHTKRFSFDPHEIESNIENFWGVAQIPIGVAGPLLVNGEHAQGEFYVPMATVEGTMLASYNRGMKVIRECGGVLTTVSEESMQRSPVFIFRNARQARDFQLWLKDNFEAIKAKAETSTSVGKLHDIESYHVHSMVFTQRGGILATGSNTDSQYGDGTRTSSTTFISIKPLYQGARYDCTHIQS